MSQEEMEIKLNLIDDMFEIEDEMIIFLNSENSISFIENTIKMIFTDNSLIIKKIKKNTEKMEDFKKSIEKHFTWIKYHIHEETEDFNDYRTSEIDVFKAYCLFYSNAIISISDYSEYEEVSKELIKYFKALKQVYC